MRTRCRGREGNQNTAGTQCILALTAKVWHVTTRTRKSDGKRERQHRDHTRTTLTANYAARGKSRMGQTLRRNLQPAPSALRVHAAGLLCMDNSL